MAGNEWQKREIPEKGGLYDDGFGMLGDNGAWTVGFGDISELGVDNFDFLGGFQALSVLFTE